jgi:hypothetical protein
MAAIATALVAALVGGYVPSPAYAEVTTAHVDDMAVTSFARTNDFGGAASRASATATGLQPFHLIGASWQGAADQGAVRVRVHTSAGWQAWQDLEIERSEAPDDGGADAQGAATKASQPSLPVWVGAADGYQLDAPQGIHDVVVHLVREATHRTVAPSSAAPAGAVTGSAGGAPAVHFRSDWGARDAARPAEYASVGLRNAIVHHTVNSNDYGPGDVPSLIRGIQAYHMDANGWSDIGYNFLVDRFGGIWEGHGGGIDKAVIGAHSGGFNTGSTGVALIGDFRVAGPGNAALEATARIVGWKLANAGVDPLGHFTATSLSSENTAHPAGSTVYIGRVSGHRDTWATSCPGQVLYNLLPAIANRAAELYPYILGSFDQVSQSPDGLRVRGWSLARGTANAINVNAIIDSGGNNVVRADSTRVDIAAAFPAFGGEHGYSFTIPMGTGSHRVCLEGVNDTDGPNYSLGCRTIFLFADPGGNVDLATRAPAGIRIAGWALDPNTAAPDAVDVYVGSAGMRTIANGDRPDVAAYAPDYGAQHGYNLVVPAPQGTNRVCAYGINLGPGSANTQLACRTVVVSDLPFGSLDGASRNGVMGWTIDPDTTNPIDVHVYVNGAFRAAVTAAAGRGDVGVAYPDYGAPHGYAVAFSPALAAGSTVCAYAINVGAGTTNPQLGCRTV